MTAPLVRDDRACHVCQHGRGSDESSGPTGSDQYTNR